MLQSFNRILNRRTRAGFTLIELAIVLGVAGLLFAGLYRLLSGGNQAMRDQAAATAQQQLISAVKGYLASSQGKTYMGANNANTNSFPLGLPTSNTSNANCRANINAAYTDLCDYLPAGFTNASSNSYGQLFNIRVVGDGRGAGTVPNTYSFMILTSGGNTIPDSSGGRVASAIGGDGGFVYNNNVCNGTTGAATNLSACGSYGAWAVATTTYGFNVGYSGSIATRTYVSPESDSNLPWLARLLQPGDTATNPTFNTMNTNMLFAMTASGNGLPKSLYFNPAATGITPAATGLGSIYMNGGDVHMQGGTLDGVGTLTMNTTGILDMNGGRIINVTGGIDMNGGTISNGYISLVQTPTNPFITLNTNCSLITTPGCPSAIFIPTGDISVANGQVNANTLFAQTFVYQASDIRLKKNIKPLHDTMKDLMELKPVSFDFKKDDRHSLGFVAQEIEKVYPELVSQNQGTKFVNYEGLIAPLVQAVQELKTENMEMRAQIKAQAEHSRELEKELKRLQAP